MKASLKTLAAEMQPNRQGKPAESKPVDVVKMPVGEAPAFMRSGGIETAPNYRLAQTRAHTRQVSAHYAAQTVQAFRVLAAELDMDVQELLAEAINMTFERHGKPDRIDIVSGRRKRRSQ